MGQMLASKVATKIVDFLQIVNMISFFKTLHRTFFKLNDPCNENFGKITVKQIQIFFQISKFLNSLHNTINRCQIKIAHRQGG